MAHRSHASPEGCCIYSSLAGAARAAPAEWDDACAETYDRAWKAALVAATQAGGVIAHHHGVGRSKAPMMGAELGAGVDVVRGLMKALDPAAILNHGNLVPPPSSGSAPEPVPPNGPSPSSPVLDVPSLLVDVSGTADLAWLDGWLREAGFTLDLG